MQIPRQLTCQAPPRAAGFTLLETMVVLAMAVIMAVVAVPSFNGALVKYRIEGQQRGLRDLLQLAHDEALGAQALTICTSANGTSCSPNADWRQGQIVFVDSGTIGVVDGTDKVIQYAQAVASGVPITATVDATGASFTRGFIHFEQGKPDVRTAVRFTLCRTGDKQRHLLMNMYGHIWSKWGTVTCV